MASEKGKEEEIYDGEGENNQKLLKTIRFFYENECISIMKELGLSDYESTGKVQAEALKRLISKGIFQTDDLFEVYELHEIYLLFQKECLAIEKSGKFNDATNVQKEVQKEAMNTLMSDEISSDLLQMYLCFYQVDINKNLKIYFLITN